MSKILSHITFAPFQCSHYKFTNLTGQIFTRLRVISIYGKSANQMTMWLCLCDCGNWSVVATNNLRNGHTRSCGCLSIDTVRERSITHHESYKDRKTPEYRAYQAALTRCNNQKDKGYPRWGGRGIQVRFESYEDFLEEVGRRPSPQHSLDRIDTNGHYEKGNVRWATKKEQSRNTRRNRMITINGDTKCLAEWCEIFKIGHTTVLARLKRGISINQALQTPPLMTSLL